MQNTFILCLGSRDDVAHHDKWAAEFGAKRIIHKSDANARQGTNACEVQLTGEGPWDVDGSSDLEIVHTPGHTDGSISLYHEPTKVMFTGQCACICRISNPMTRSMIWYHCLWCCACAYVLSEDHMWHDVYPLCCSAGMVLGGQLFCPLVYSFFLDLCRCGPCFGVIKSSAISSKGMGESHADRVNSAAL